MARNGSGSFALYTPGNPVSTGTTIDPNWANNTLTDIATALTQSISNDGQTPITANLQMTGFRHTGVGNATARTDYCSAGQAQDNTFDWLTSVAGTDTITASAPIGMTAYAAGQTFRFVAAGANTGTAVTLNINALGAKSVTKLGSTALAVGDIPSGAVVEVVYDGTRFQIIGLAVQHAATADTAITQTSGDNSTNIATTAFVSNLVGGTTTAASSIGTSGYQKLSSGLIMQWGYATSSAGAAGTAITLPIAFPTSTLFAGGTVSGGTSSTTYPLLVVGGVTASGFSTFITTAPGTAGSNLGGILFYWFAIGH